MVRRAIGYARYRFAHRSRRADIAAFSALIVLVLLVPFALRGRLFGESIRPEPDGTVQTAAPSRRTPEPLRGPPPNVVFILTDDQRFDDMDVMTNVKELLADRGVTFTNSFASTPLCCPSRASILTGSYSRTTRVYDNKQPLGGVQAFNDRSTIATRLQKAGYLTGYVGKYLNGYEQIRDPSQSFVPTGWSSWHGLVSGQKNEYYDYYLNENGRMNYFGNEPSDYMTDVFRDRAVSFIDEASSPFFLHFAPYAPHLPGRPAPQDVDAIAGE
jgi:arylsulfatase A-like enzyme